MYTKDELMGKLNYATLRKTLSLYDNAGRLKKSILNPDGASGRLAAITTYYDYDELSRIAKVIDPEQWDASGGTPGSADHTAYVYDNASRLKQVKAHVDLGSGAQDYTLAKYAYFQNGARSQMTYTRTGSDINVDYEYYPTGWLKSVEYPGYNGNTDKYEYTYFDTGVLESVSLLGTRGSFWHNFIGQATNTAAALSGHKAFADIDGLNLDGFRSDYGSTYGKSVIDAFEKLLDGRKALKDGEVFSFLEALMWNQYGSKLLSKGWSMSGSKTGEVTISVPIKYSYFEYCIDSSGKKCFSKKGTTTRNITHTFGGHKAPAGKRK